MWKKIALLAMAASGMRRPHGRDKFYSILNRLVSPASGDYDPEFEKAIERFWPRPCSPKRPYIRVSRKDVLLAMAKAGKPRPKSHTKELSWLSHFELPSGGSYDPDFAREIHLYWPMNFHWRSTENKAEILAMARRGDPRPAATSRIWKLIDRYTRKVSRPSLYDAEFHAEIRRYWPDLSTLAKTKRDHERALWLDRARRGEQRPEERSKEGRHLRYLMSENPLFRIEANRLWKQNRSSNKS